MPIRSAEGEFRSRLPMEETMKKKLFPSLAVLVIAAAMVLSACGGGGSGSSGGASPSSPSGTVEGNAK